MKDLELFKSDFNKLAYQASKYFRSQRIKLGKNLILAIGGVILIIAVLYTGTKISSVGSSSDERVEAPAPIATQNLNKTFDFPLKDDKGKEVSKIKFVVESANLQDAFIYKGKLARAVKGRTFLLFNLKITNSYEQGVTINSKDYIRISVGESSELLAPEIHNDPVEIQATSTKFTRIGMPINDADTKNIKIFVGELKGEKTEIKLSLER